MTDDAPDADHVSVTSLRIIRERVGAVLIDATRTAAIDLTDPAQPRRAAVAIVLREIAVGPEILLIRRAERSGDPWSGHMAFPGGREGRDDDSLLATAIRETHEEIGLDLTQSGGLLGQLEPLQAMAHGRRVPLVIAPFVFELTRDAELTYQRDEVAEALWVPLDPLMRGNLRTTFAYDIDGLRTDLPAHDVEGRIVWGLTYRMLENLFALLR